MPNQVFGTFGKLIVSYLLFYKTKELNDFSNG